MAKCPVCHADIKEDFGLVTCPSCGSQVLLEFDGSANAATSSESVLVDELSQVLVADLNVVAPPPLPALEPMTTAPTPVEEKVILPATPDMSEIADYGNSSMSQGREGFLRFNIFIGGIDTSDIRGEVKEILSDSRFLWDAEAIMTSLRDGELQIKEVTAVKSTLLIQRLRSLPVEIRWEQYAIHQA